MQASELHAAGLGWALLCLRMRYFGLERSNSLQQCCWVALGLSSIQWGMAAPTHQLFAPLVHPWGRKAPQRCLERAEQLQQGHNKGTLNFFPEEPLAGWAQAGEHMAVGRGDRMALLRGHEVQVFKPKELSRENDLWKVLRTKNSLSQRLQTQLNCGRQAYGQPLLGSLGFHFKASFLSVFINDVDIGPECIPNNLCSVSEAQMSHRTTSQPPAAPASPRARSRCPAVVPSTLPIRIEEITPEMPKL